MDSYEEKKSSLSKYRYQIEPDNSGTNTHKVAPVPVEPIILGTIPASWQLAIQFEK